MENLVCSIPTSFKAPVFRCTSKGDKQHAQYAPAVQFPSVRSRSWYAKPKFERLSGAESFRDSRDSRIYLRRTMIAMASTESTVASVQKAVPPSKIWNGSKLLCALIPVVLTLAISKWLSLGLEQEVFVATFRASAQLVTLGFALKVVFEEQHITWCIIGMTAILVIAGQTSGERAKELPRSKTVATIALIGGAFSTIWLMVLLRVLPVEPKSLIPATGFCMGVSMSALSTTLKTIANDVRVHEPEIEAALALGATPHQAVREHLRRSLILSLGPICDHLKVSGLVTLPGAMTGMLMSGSQPLEAVRSSLLLLYMLLGAAALTSVLGAQLGWRPLFTNSMQVVRTA